MESTLASAKMDDDVAGKPCVFGEEIKKVCPVMLAIAQAKTSRSAFNKIAKPNIPGFPSEFAEVSAGLEHITSNLMMSNMTYVVAFCNVCPFLENYKVKYERGLTQTFLKELEKTSDEDG